MHNYEMPPYSTGETGRVGSPKRREIGHGALAPLGLVAGLVGSLMNRSLLGFQTLYGKLPAWSRPIPVSSENIRHSGAAGRIQVARWEHVC